MKSFEIFRPGTHTTGDGRRITFTAADVAKTASAYDPAKREAPFVIGHPKQDAPAYGWVKGLGAGPGGALTAEPHQVDAQFAEAVAAGRYKQRSASFYAPDSPRNPVPGVWYLRHVGFLGAAQPAVAGLRPVEFAEGEEGVVEFAEDYPGRSSLARMARRLREWLLEKFDADTADRVAPSWECDMLDEAARPPAEPQEPAPAFGEQEEETMKTITLTEADLQTRIQAAVTAALGQKEASFSEREQALTTRERETTRAAIARWLDGLAVDAQLLPQWKADAAAFAELLDDHQGTVEFAEGDTKVQAPAGERFRKWVEGMSAHPLFKEMVGPAKQAATADAQFAEEDAAVQRLVAYVQPMTGGK
jgi:hypothetical protein